MSALDEADGPDHTPDSTRPPSSSGSARHTPTHMGGSPFEHGAETSIRAGLSPDLRSVDEEMMSLHAALHQLRTAPPQPSSLFGPVGPQSDARDATCDRFSLTSQLSAPVRGAVTGQKRTRLNTSGETSPGVAQDKKRERLSVPQQQATHPRDFGTTSAPRAINEEDHEARRTAKSAVKASSSAQPTMVRQYSGAVRTSPFSAASGTLSLSRPPPLTRTSALTSGSQPSSTPSPVPTSTSARGDPAARTHARERSAGEVYLEYRRARTGTTPMCARSPSVDGVPDAVAGPRVQTSQGRTGGTGNQRPAIIAPRMLRNRAASPTWRERSVVIDDREATSPTQNHDEKQHGEEMTRHRTPVEHAPATTPSAWRRSPVCWASRLSGTLESDIAKVKRVLAAGHAPSPRHHGSGSRTEHNHLAASGHPQDRLSASQPPPPPPPPNLRAGAVREKAGTPPPRFEEDEAQFQHAARAWRRPPQSPATSNTTTVAAVAMTRASVDGMMAYYTRLAAGCRRTPFSSAPSLSQHIE